MADINEQEITTDVFGLDDILSSEEENVAAVTLETEHLIIIKKAMASFLKFCNIHTKTGTDVYTRSFYLSRKEAEYVDLVYANGNVYGKKKIKTIVNDNQLLDSFIFDFNAFVKSINPTCSQLLLIKEDGKVFGHVFGGHLYIQTQNVSDTLYNFMELGEPDEELTVNIVQFMSLLKSLLTLSVSGARAEERAVYFEKDAAYVYSGPVVGKFPGTYLPLCLQNLDVQSILAFFEDLKTDIKISVYKNHVKFSSEEDYLILNKKNLVLPSAIKEKSFIVDSGVHIDPLLLHQIFSLLLNSPSGFGTAKVESADFGINIISSSKVGNTNSKFPVYASKEGNGLTVDGVKVPLKTLKSYLSAFNSQILMDIREDQLFIKGDIGSVIITGISN